jgi:peptidoglycan hydrolase-like protein with peptidoglycan-binding domain
VVRDAAGVLRETPLRAGANGALVSELQRLLCLTGDSPGQVDGVFGPATAAAVRRFQRANRVTADGIVDLPTWNSLRRRVRGPMPVAGARRPRGSLPARENRVQRSS